MKLTEIDFKSQGAYKDYKTKHKMRATTKVNIAGKDTTAGEADKVDKDQGSKPQSKMEKRLAAMRSQGMFGNEKDQDSKSGGEETKGAAMFNDEESTKKYPSMDDAEAIMDEFKEGGLEKGVDYEETTAYGDDVPNEIIALSDKAKEIVDQYEDGDDYHDDSSEDTERSLYGAKQKGIGAGSENLTGPTDDANSVSGDAKAEKKVLEKLRSITKENDVDLCTIAVPGTNLFCAGNKQIPRSEMPQLKSKVVSGGKADELVKAGKLDIDAKTGEVNTEDLFKTMLESEGITMKDPEPRQVTSLKATQNQLVGSKVNMFAKVLAGDQPFEGKEISSDDLKKWQDALREPIIASKDGYILDGHHRWAALVQHDIANGGTGDVEMDVKEVDMEAEALVDRTNKFTNDMGLEVKSGGKTNKKEGTMKLADIIQDELVKELNDRQDTLSEGRNELLLKQKHLSSAEYQKIQRLRGFSERDFDWNPKTQLYTNKKLVEGRPIPMDTPNEFAYKDFKKFAHKNRSQYKKDMKKHIINGEADGSRMYMTASSWWYKWAYHNNKEFTHIKDKLKFGRALIVMMVKDDVIFDKKAWKKDNKITTIKEAGKGWALYTDGKKIKSFRSKPEALRALKLVQTVDNSVELRAEGKLNEMDINDPILVAIRARATMLKKAKAAPKVKKISMNQYYKLMDTEIDIINDMKSIAKELAQLNSDMLQDAGQKGEDWSDTDANKYGGDLNKLETKYEKFAKMKSKVQTAIQSYRIN